MNSEIRAFELKAVYKLPYGNLIFNNTNFWLKTTKMNIFKYPNIKVKKNTKPEPLKIFKIEENKLYYKNIFICDADAVDENNFLAYKFHKKNDEIILEEFDILVADYFDKIYIFDSFQKYLDKIKKFELKDNFNFEGCKIMKHLNKYMVLKGVQLEKGDSSDQLDFTIPEISYFYKYKSIIAFCEPFLKIEKNDKISNYYSNSVPLIDIENFLIYKKKCKITNLIFFDSYKNFKLAITPENVFLIYKNLIICKKEENVIGASLKKQEIFTFQEFLSGNDFSEFYFLLGMYFEFAFKIEENKIYVEVFKPGTVPPFRLKKIENIVIQLILSKYHNFIEPFLTELFSTKSKETESFYVNLYRRLDDKNRKYLEKFNYKILNIENLYKIILFLPDMIEYFVKLAIEQEKEYFICELLNFYKKQNFSEQLKELEMILLKNNEFYLFSLCSEENKSKLESISEILAVEKSMIRGQYNRDLFYK